MENFEDKFVFKYLILSLSPKNDKITYMKIQLDKILSFNKIYHSSYLHNYQNFETVQ